MKPEYLQENHAINTPLVSLNLLGRIPSSLGSFVYLILLDGTSPLGSSERHLALHRRRNPKAQRLRASGGSNRCGSPLSAHLGLRSLWGGFNAPHN